MRSMLARSLSPSLLLAASSLAVACGGSSSQTPAPTPSSDVVQSALSRNMHPTVATSDESKLVADNTTFAFNLYHQVIEDSPTSNIFYSPYSISIALSMAYNGAKGSTATQMASALQFDQPSSTLDTAFDKLDLALRSLGGGTPSKSHPFHLNVADSTWADKTFHFVPAYLDTLAVDYGSNLHVVDFEQDSPAALSAINSWVSSETDGKIPNLLSPDSISADTRFVLVNAIYFDAAWQSPFDPAETANQPFTRLDGSKVSAPLMNTELDSTGYVAGTGFQAVDLPYDGGSTSMVVVLPAEGQFKTIEAGLDEAFYQKVTSSLAPTSVNLGLPKFDIQGATISLKTELTKLGMTEAFTPQANFSGLAAEPIWIGDVLHQAFVSVDESGTQAAAATAVTGVGLAAPSSPVNVEATRPFLFFIRDVASNTVLFAGKVLDPTT
jgi:serpin B